jgi:hypothetical protein
MDENPGELEGDDSPRRDQPNKKLGSNHVNLVNPV